MPPGPVESLAALLDLRQTDDGRFEAPTHGPDAGVQRIFGGHVAAQALIAATRTVGGDRPAHSIHCSYLRSGRPGLPLSIEVVPERDGRAFSTRRVTVRQRTTPIMDMTASFHDPEPGEDWTATPMPAVADADDLPPSPTFLHNLPTLSVFDCRLAVDVDDSFLEPAHPVWLRASAPLPDEPSLHVAVIAALTDLGAVRSTMRPGFQRPEAFTGATLDHGVWFHRPARADEWLLFNMEPLSNHVGRGLGIGRAWSRDGVHVATWIQESLLRSR